MGEMIVNLETFAKGSLAEQINTEFQKIIDNIADPNTEAAKVRKLAITITVKPKLNRSGAQVFIQSKPTLAPEIPAETTIMIDRDLETGKIMAAEIGNQVPGQMEMDLDVEEKTDPGATVIDLRKAKNE